MDFEVSGISAHSSLVNNLLARAPFRREPRKFFAFCPAIMRFLRESVTENGLSLWHTIHALSPHNSNRGPALCGLSRPSSPHLCGHLRFSAQRRWITSNDQELHFSHREELNSIPHRLVYIWRGAKLISFLASQVRLRVGRSIGNIDSRSDWWEVGQSVGSDSPKTAGNR